MKVTRLVKNNPGITSFMIMMKRTILSCLFTLATWQLVYAQMESRFSIGPRIGTNFANVNSGGPKNLSGLAAGITSTYSVNERSGITVDLLYSGEGFKVFDIDFTLNYLKIPILYNVFFGKLGEGFRPKVFLGIAPGFLLSANSNNIDLKNYHKSSAVDLVGGLGFNHRVANRIWLNADLCGFYGLSPLEKSRPQKNRTLQASLGFAYGI